MIPTITVYAADLAAAVRSAMPTEAPDHDAEGCCGGFCDTPKQPRLLTIAIRDGKLVVARDHPRWGAWTVPAAGPAVDSTPVVVLAEHLAGIAWRAARSAGNLRIVAGPCEVTISRGPGGATWFIPEFTRAASDDPTPSPAPLALDGGRTVIHLGRRDVDALRMVARAAGPASDNPFLACVHFAYANGRIQATSTDRYRLHRAQIDVEHALDEEFGGGFTVEALDLLDATRDPMRRAALVIHEGDKRTVTIETDRGASLVRARSGEWIPTIDQIVSDDPATAAWRCTANVADLLAAVEAACATRPWLPSAPQPTTLAPLIGAIGVESGPLVVSGSDQAASRAVIHATGMDGTELPDHIGGEWPTARVNPFLLRDAIQLVETGGDVVELACYRATRGERNGMKIVAASPRVGPDAPGRLGLVMSLLAEEASA